MMKHRSLFAVGLFALVGVVPLAAQGCSDTDTSADGGTDAATTATGTGDPTSQPTVDPPADAAIDTGPVSCTAALENALKPIDKVSTGAVNVLDQDDAGSGLVIYVDATAGGVAAANQNPRTYVALATGTRVEVTDKTAQTSTDWDLALERAVLFTNSGQGGPGAGSAVYVGKPFADVNAADATGKSFPPEKFVDENCRPIVDQTNAIKSTFDGWYDYDLATSKVTPKTGTFLVKSGKGELFKVAILQYYAVADGGTGTSGANYVLRIGKL